MRDEDCVRFLQWALPRMRLRWPGFRKVRRQVCRRIARRMEALDCADVNAYRARLEDDPDEWRQLEPLCRVTISRFWRDRHVFDALRTTILPELARAAQARRASMLRCCCIGCASGEEPYTVALLWHLELAEQFPNLFLEMIATDIDPTLLSRAKTACYPESSLRDLPDGLKRNAFSRSGDELCLDERFRVGIDFRRQDVRNEVPNGPFDLLLCRNLVFTYFDKTLQREIESRLVEQLVPEGAFVVGERESPLNGELGPWIAESGIYRKRRSPW